MTKKLQGTRLLRELFQVKDKRNVVLQGGARASKTYTLAQYLILKCINEWAGAKKIITIARKTFPALRGSVMRDFFEILTSLGLYSQENHNKSTSEYTLSGNLIEFISVDQPQKVRGRKRDYCWLNEANEFEYEDFFQFNIRTNNQMWFDYNPSDEFHWLYDKIIPRDDTVFIQSTYKDNPFLSDALKEEIERLKDEDENLWKIYGLGEKGRAKDIIFSNWDTIDMLPRICNYNRYGVDFGYNHPSVVLFVGAKEKEVYVDEVIHETHLTNQDLMDRIKSEGLEKNILMRADSAEPDRIAEIRDAGYWIDPAKKGRNSIKDGIDVLARCKIHITNRSVNTLKEIKNYRWRTDKLTGEVLDEPLKYNDHCMDAMRYAIGGMGLDSDVFRPVKSKFDGYKSAYIPEETFMGA